MAKETRSNPPQKQQHKQAMQSSNDYTVTRNKHIRYFVHCLKLLPAQYSHLDTNRLTLLHFAIHSLDILGFFDDERNLERYDIDKSKMIKWIYSLQITSSNDSRTTIRKRQQNEVEDNGELSQSHEDIVENNYKSCCINLSPKRNNIDNFNVYKHDTSTTRFSNYQNVGFKGGTFLFTDNDTIAMEEQEEKESISKTKLYNQGHIAMTYTALCTLLALGDNLQAIDRAGIIHCLKILQQPNGSYQCRSSGSENDLRFLYCACAISYILNDWSGMNIPKALEYIRSCKSYDGAYGLIPGQEGHGGSTFCAVACLVLMGVIDTELSSFDQFSGREELIQWCLMRQIRGLQGRPNKYEDTCYSYWIGGTLCLLQCDHLLDKEALNLFVLGCQTDLGGFSKLEDGCFPDLLHSFYSLAWLSISVDPRQGSDNVQPYQQSSLVLKPLDCALGMCASHVDKFMMDNGAGTDSSTEYDSDEYDSRFCVERNLSFFTSSCLECFRSPKRKSS